ncbi:MAG: ATP-binding protein, partial [Methanosarcinales archaeon]
MKSKPKIFTVVPEDEFVDRERILDILYTNALDAAREASDNTFIIGRRRIGKSAVLTRLYDKLFFEQDIVVPFYYTFEGKGKRAYTIAESYFTSFVSQYLAFKKKDVTLIKELRDLDLALNLAVELKDEGLASVIRGYINSKAVNNVHEMLNMAIGGPRMVSNDNQSPICVILDEFQYILGVVDDDGWDVDLKGKYQFGVEGTYCPHFVSGSAVSIITNEILTKGALVGRFGEKHLDKLDLDSALELGRKLAKKFGFELPHEQNIYLANYTDRLPYYIYRILYAIRESKEKLVTEEVLSNAISSEITRGGIYGELERQLLEYAELNNLNIIRSVLYLASNYEEKQIIPSEIAEKLKVPEIEVSKALIQISSADLIENLGGFYYNVPDPIMREFLRTQYFHKILKIPIKDLEEEKKTEVYTELSDSARMLGLLLESHLKLL